MGLEGLMVSHFQFADDTFVLRGKSFNQMVHFHCVIRWFEAVFG